MPAVLLPTQDRRSFLKTSALGVLTIVAGCRSSVQRASVGPEYHLALLSDTHIPGDRVNGHRGFNPWENLRRIVPDVAAVKPEGVVLCGDAARLEGQVADYEELRSLVQPLAAEVPMAIALGNHDDRVNFLKVIQSVPGGESQVKDRHVLVLEHEVIRVVVLDSLLEVNRVPGLLGKAQRDWLTEYLGTHRDRPVALFVHHTLGDRDGDLLDSDRFFALLQPHRHVKAIFYGHSHVWERTQRDHIQLINLPAVGYNFNDKDPVGWVDARFRRGGVSLTLRAFAGNRAEDGQTADVRWM